MNNTSINYFKPTEQFIYSDLPAPMDTPPPQAVLISTDPPSTVQNVFRRILTEKAAPINTVGEIRFKSFEESLKKRSIEITPEERSCLIEIFSQFKNQTFDYPLHILMLSLNRDFNKAIETPSLSSNTRDKIVRFQKFLAGKCVEFCNEVRNQNFLSVFSLSSDEPISKFQKTIDLTFATICSMFPEKMLGKMGLKQQILNKFLATPQFYDMGMERFSFDDIEESKGEEISIYSMPSIQRIDSERSDFLTEVEMVDFLLEYTEWLQSYYKAQSVEGKLISEVLPKLKKIKDLIPADLVAARNERTLLLGTLMQTKREISAELTQKQSHKYLRMLGTLLQRDQEDFFLKARAVSSLCDFDLFLDRMIVSLGTLIDDQTLLLISKRLLSNLETIQKNPILINHSNDLQELESDFSELFITIKSLISSPFMKKSKELLNQKFDGVSTPKILQELCLKFGKHQLSDVITERFAQIHSKYLHQAQELKKLGRKEEQEKLVKTYINLCFSLIPLFFCLHDIQNLRNDTQADDDEIVPELILDCFDLDIESSNQSVEPPKEELDRDAQGNSLVTPETDSSPPIPSPVVQAVPTPPSISAPSIPLVIPTLREISSSPHPPASSEELTFRIPKNLKRRKLKQFFKEQFRLKPKERTRHTGIYSSDGKMVTLLSRGSRDIPRGTLSGMNKRLNKIGKNNSPDSES